MIDRIIRDRITSKICYRGNEYTVNECTVDDWSKYLYKHDQYFMYGSSSNSDVADRVIAHDMKRLKDMNNG